ncbi:hypothetical protein [Escherichia coli]|uniref:hypothetical protein n=1 Tax=Escherichia coli TaxID=562 RepID=UPI0023589F4B|nr:hypothetical protein [Escherichia coli]MDC9115074.1 hypothetical protein [Escherichia coli]
MHQTSANPVVVNGKNSGSTVITGRIANGQQMDQQDFLPVRSFGDDAENHIQGLETDLELRDQLQLTHVRIVKWFDDEIQFPKGTFNKLDLTGKLVMSSRVRTEIKCWRT